MKTFILEMDYLDKVDAEAGLDRMLRYGVTNYSERPEVYSYGNLETRRYAIRCFIPEHRQIQGRAA